MQAKTSQESNALVLADTRERSTVARNKLVASSALHDASLGRVRAIGRVEFFVLGDGAVRTLHHGRRDALG